MYPVAWSRFLHSHSLSLALSSPTSLSREEEVGEKSLAQKRRAGEEEEVGEYDRAGDGETKKRRWKEMKKKQRRRNLRSSTPFKLQK